MDGLENSVNERARSIPSTKGSAEAERFNPGQAEISGTAADHSQSLVRHQNSSKPVRFGRSLLYLSATAALVLSALQCTFSLFSSEAPINPQDYAKRTEKVLATTPLIDGHNDLPYLLRIELKNKIYNDRFTFENGLLSHTDLQKMRQGQIGGQFWSVYLHCSEVEGIKTDDPTVCR